MSGDIQPLTGLTNVTILQLLTFHRYAVTEGLLQGRKSGLYPSRRVSTLAHLL